MILRRKAVVAIMFSVLVTQVLTPMPSIMAAPDSNIMPEESVEEYIEDIIEQPSDEEKNKTPLDEDDLIVSDKPKPVNGKTRVTEVYSINNSLGDCYYRPSIDEVPLLSNRVLKIGGYSAAYTGFFDLGKLEPSKPKGEQSRALEILGYDFLLDKEEYDTRTRSYKRTITGTQISQKTAVMNVYKALGLEQHDINTYSERGAYTSDNSPVASLLNRATKDYNNRDTLDPYYTYVFVTRTNPELYMKKLANDFNVSMGTDKSGTMTLADFIILSARMMEYYGEPVLSEKETNQLLQAYGAEIPIGMESSLEEAWVYLKSRGVLNINTSNIYGDLKKSDMYNILMCIKDESSRTNYKEIQLTYELNQDLIDKGYYPQEISVTQVNEIAVEGSVSYQDSEVFDYLVPINDFARFRSSSSEEVNTQYISSSPDTSGMVLLNSSYAGTVDGSYYHFIVPAEVAVSSMKNGTHIRIDTLGVEDKPGCIYLQNGGGVYKYTTSEGTGSNKENYFKRRPFNDIEYEDYVDKERKQGNNDFNYDEWGESDSSSGTPEYGEIVPDVPEVGSWDLDDWQGPSVSSNPVVRGEWVKEVLKDKWRYYTYNEDGSDRRYLTGNNGYYIGESITGDIADSYFLFDSEGYMYTGWYKDGYLWAYLKEDGHLAHDTTLNIDGTEYSFDSNGWWLDNNYNKPEEEENDWAHLTNLQGQWQMSEDDDRWWYMLTDGSYPIDSVELINDRMYCFDDDGWMKTGWHKEGSYFYYFDRVDGFMLTSTTTPDGYKVDSNGRALGKVKLAVTKQLYNALESFARAFTPITAYANSSSIKYNNGIGGLAYNDSRRKYNVSIYLSLIEEEEEDVKSRILSQDASAKFQKISGQEEALVVFTKLKPETVASLLTFSNTENSNLTLVTAATGISKIGSTASGELACMVPFEQLVEAGIFTDTVRLDNGILQLNAMQTSTYYDSDGVASEVQGNTRGGFGQITIDNKNQTIMVGPTIYTIKEGQQLFSFLPANEELVSNYGYVDKDGNPLTDMNSVLYVDLRVAFGWAANEIRFYRMGNSGDVNTGGGSQIVITAGVAKDKQGQIVRVKQMLTKTNNANYADLQTRVIPDYYNNRPAILAANSYPLASYAILDIAKNNGSKSIYQVSYFPEYAYNLTGSVKPDSSNDITKLKAILPEGKKYPEIDGYVCKVTDIGRSIKTVQRKDGNTLQPGKWYLDRDFGYFYLAPTKREWEANNGYVKWLNGEWTSSLVYDSTNGSIIEMAVPAFTDGSVEYGDVQADSSFSGESLLPTFSALSYFLFTEQGNSVSLSSIGDESNKKKFFGANSFSTEVVGGKNKIVINGLATQGNNRLSLNEEDLGDKKLVLVNRSYQQSNDSSEVIEYYVVSPGAIRYSEADGSESAVGEVVLGAGKEQNLFKGYTQFSRFNLRNMVDKGLAIVILFTVNVLPLFLFTASIIVFGLSLMSDFELVKKLCHNVFDPISLLTFKSRNIDTVGGMRFFLSLILVNISSALCIDGNILRIINWIFKVVSVFLDRINMM